MLSREALFYTSALVVAAALFYFFGPAANDRPATTPEPTGVSLDEVVDINVQPQESFETNPSVNLKPGNETGSQASAVNAADARLRQHSEQLGDDPLESTEVIDLGAHIDPESLPVEDYDSPDIHLGEDLDPDDPSMEAYWGAESTIDLGTPMDP